MVWWSVRLCPGGLHGVIFRLGLEGLEKLRFRCVEAGVLEL